MDRRLQEKFKVKNSVSVPGTASKKTIMSWMLKKKQDKTQQDKAAGKKRDAKRDKDEDDFDGGKNKKKRRKKNDYEFDHLNDLDGAVHKYMNVLFTQ